MLSGGLTIFAAGNDEASGNWYPGCYSGAMAVAATNNKDIRSWYSNYDTWVEISAPGGETSYANDPKGVLSTISGNSYAFYQGTSMACPHVSGVAALVLSHAHRHSISLSNTELRNLLKNTTDNHYAVNPTYMDKLGTGRLNAHAALLALNTGQPSVSISSPANGSIHDLGDTILVSATAADNDGSIVSVAFYVDGVLENTDYTAPYSWNWDTVSASPGIHIVKAVATDNDAKTVESSISIRLKTGILEELTIGSGTSTQSYPLDRYYRYSGHEAIYLASEIGKVGAINSIGYYKASGDNTDPIEATSIYMKHSTESTLSTGNYSLEGYTLVYSGAFPNNASSGWMEVDLDQWFDYDGASKLSILVIKGYQTWIPSYPQWRYSTSSTYRARQNHDDSSQPLSLSQTTSLPNLRLKIYSAPVFNPPQNLSAIAGNQSVSLNWQAPIQSVPDSYKIYKDGSLLTSVADLNYQDNAVSNGTQYSYYVVAVYPLQDSEPSNIVEVIPNMEAILGSGNLSTGGAASPINANFFSSHGQSVYTKAELNAAGISGAGYITYIGFNVIAVPSRSLPNFIMRMKHSSATNVLSWQNATGMQTVYSNPSYTPQTGWDMLALSNPFYWDGENNLVVDTAFGMLSNSGSTGSVYYTNVSSGYRYVRSSSSDQTGVFSGGDIHEYRPNLKLIFAPAAIPEFSVDPSSHDFGSIIIGESAMQIFTISNAGTGTLTIDQVELQTADAGFSLQDAHSYPVHLSEAETIEVSVVFSPETAGDFSATLLITDALGGKVANEVLITGSAQEGTLPVTLSSFTAVPTGHGHVRLDWVTASETAVMGYYILRSDSDDIAEAAAVSSLVEAANASDGAYYSFRDKSLMQNGTYYYWLNNLDFSGVEGFFGPLAVHVEAFGANSGAVVPLVTEAMGNYPNPFNPVTYLRYSLAKAGNVQIRIFNPRGQLVRTLSQEHNLPGYFSIIFDGKDSAGRELSSGVYLYKMQIGAYLATDRMILLK